MAERAGLIQAQISHIEKGQTKFPSPENVRRILLALGE